MAFGSQETTVMPLMPQMTPKWVKRGCRRADDSPSSLEKREIRYEGWEISAIRSPRKAWSFCAHVPPQLPLSMTTLHRLQLSLRLLGETRQETPSFVSWADRSTRSTLIAGLLGQGNACHSPRHLGHLTPSTSVERAGRWKMIRGLRTDDR